MPALVLELVEGPTLAERLLEGPVPVKSAVAIAMQIADALEAAHRQGIIHRDLKPANVKVRSDFVKLLDFGLAKGVGHQDTGSASSTVAVSPTTSRPGAVMGTAAYMSPEQARGEPVDGRSDLFSLGAVLYEMVTGRPAFSGDTSSAILRAILNDTPPFPRALDPHVPAALENVVMRLLAKDRSARPQQASAVRSEFQRLASELDAGSYRWLRRWRRSGAAAAAVILVGLAIWTARRPAPGTLAEREYTQITHFADSVTSPAVSSDGRLLTFIRGASTFHGPGEIYVKALPDGEPRPLTSDGLDKMSSDTDHRTRQDATLGVLDGSYQSSRESLRGSQLRLQHTGSGEKEQDRTPHGETVVGVCARTAGELRQSRDLLPLIRSAR